MKFTLDGKTFPTFDVCHYFSPDCQNWRKENCRYWDHKCECPMDTMGKDETTMKYNIEDWRVTKAILSELYEEETQLELEESYFWGVDELDEEEEQEFQEIGLALDMVKLDIMARETEIEEIEAYFDEMGIDYEDE